MKSKTILTAIALAFLFSCNPAPHSNPETEKIVNEFFDTYRNSPREAIINLLAKNRWITNEDTNKLVVQLDELSGQIGKFQGQELIRQDSYGKNILQYVYIAKYERQPLKFIFRFYRPNDTWDFHSFNYEVDFMNALEEFSNIPD